MHAVTTVVKNAMLGSPGLFPTRLSALSFIFLNDGGGYYWNELGEPDCIYGMPAEATTMNMKDLNESIALAKKLGAECNQPETMNFQLADAKLKKLQRKHVADHIDLYAQHRDTSVSLADMSMLPMTSDLSGTLLGSLSKVHNLNKDWAMAGHEVVSLGLQAVRKAMADNTLPAHMAGMETALVQALDHLEPVTHARENTARMALEFESMWDKALGL